MSDCPPGCLVNFSISYLREKHCQTGVIRVNRLANIRVCIAKYHCHLYFNHRFNEYNVFPSSLRFRSPVQSAKGYKFSPLIKALDRTFEALVGSMNCNFSVTFIKSLNQSSITPCQIDMKKQFYRTYDAKIGRKRKLETFKSAFNMSVAKPKTSQYAIRIKENRARSQ